MLHRFDFNPRDLNFVGLSEQLHHAQEYWDFSELLEHQIGRDTYRYDVDREQQERSFVLYQTDTRLRPTTPKAALSVHEHTVARWLVDHSPAAGRCR